MANSHFSKTGLIAVVFLFTTTPTNANPNALNYQGRIVKSDGQPLDYHSVSFIFEIASPNGSCIIYREQRNGINMTNSKGLFDIPIGAAGGVKLYPADPLFKLTHAFQANTTFTCDGGGTYTPDIADVRKLKVQFNDGVGWNQISPDNEVNSVPFAMSAITAQKIGSLTELQILPKPNFTCASNEFLKWDGSQLVCLTPAGGGLSPTGVSAGTYGSSTEIPRFTVDAEGRLTAASTTTIPAPTWASVTGTPTTLAGYGITDALSSSTILPISSGGTGNSTVAGALQALSPLSTKGDLLTHSGSAHLRLPAGTNGQALISDSAAPSGLKWDHPLATDLASIVSTGLVLRTGAATYSTLGVASPLLINGTQLEINTGTTAGTVAAGNDPRFGIAWKEITSNYTATKGDRLLVNTQAGSITLTLPASPTLGDTISILDATGSFQTNKLIINRNGEKIMGLSEDMDVTDANISFELVFYNSSMGWRIK